MKSAKGKILVTINLPNKFINIIKNEINDEIAIAQKKWKVDFKNTSEELFAKDLIVDQSLNQIESKTLSIFGRSWDFSDKISILVNSYASDEITLPDERVKLNFVRQGQNWCIDSEKIDKLNSIPASEFPAEIEQLLKNWARTAAFYGIGSFS